MQDAWLTYLVVFFEAVAVSWGVSSLVLWRFRRRCLELEWAVGELQTKVSSFKGKELADKRWTKEKAFNDEMASVLQGAPAARRKYDNDPLGDS